MHKNSSVWDPYLGAMRYWSAWMNGRAARLPRYVSKFKAWRPIQQRPRDGTVVRHRTGGLRRVA